MARAFGLFTVLLIGKVYSDVVGMGTFGDELDAMAAAEIAASLSANDLMAGVRELHHHKQQEAPMYTPPVQVPLPGPPVMAPMMMMAAPPVDMRQEIACPAGYDLKGSNCVANELIGGDLTCPPGTQMFDGRCAVFSRGRRDCPDGYRVSGGRCIASEIVPAEFTCTEGELDETGTGCRIFHDVGAQCPAGFRLEADGMMCVQQFPAQIACPPGHQMNRNGCVRELGMEASPMCPLGTELDQDGTRCFTLHPGKAKCPKGFKMSHKTGKCVKKARKALAACPEGFSEYSGHKAICERMLSIPPQLTCPPGAVLDPATGHCHTENMAATRCPDGFVPSRSQGQMCEKIVQEVGVCPPGSTTLGHGSEVRCQSAIEHDIIECCPPGFERLAGRCQRHEVFAAVSKCQGDCARVRVLAPILRCPEGFELDGRRCHRITAMACPELLPACAPYARGGSLRRLSSEQLPSGCESNIKAVEICHSSEAIPAELVCPAGDFDGTNCIVADTQSAERERICRYGVMDPLTGQCIKITQVPTKTECPLGTTRIGRRCVEYEEHLPEFVCPEGAVSDRSGSCILRAPALNAGMNVIKSAPIPVCAAGTLQGALCYDVERVPRQFVCPEGSIPANRYAGDSAIALGSPEEANRYCVLVSDVAVSAPAKKYVKPQFYCPDGTLAKGGHCKSSERAEAIISCPPGSDLEGQLCSRRVAAATGGSRVTSAAATPICPPGTTVQGTKCVASRELAVDVKCPPGYMPQPGVMSMDKECVKFTDMIMSCPVGTIQTADGCLRERTTAPVIKAATVTGCQQEYCD